MGLGPSGQACRRPGRVRGRPGGRGPPPWAERAVAGDPRATHRAEGIGLVTDQIGARSSGTRDVVVPLRSPRGFAANGDESRWKRAA